MRTFINTFPGESYHKFEKLLMSDNYNKRRLVSEWSRIILPRAANIFRTPEQVIALLDHLYADSTRYVTRSVANNLNGLSKIDPTLVLETIQKREEEWKQDPQEFLWIKKHALRTLLKQLHPQAFAEFGYHDPSHLRVAKLKYTKQVTIGDTFKIIRSDSRWQCTRKM